MFFIAFCAAWFRIRCIVDGKRRDLGEVSYRFPIVVSLVQVIIVCRTVPTFSIADVCFNLILRM